MRLFKPSVLKNFLKELGISPIKALSQHFLIDGNIVNKILNAAHVKRGDFVVEIGSGPGVLTEALLERGVTLLSIEKDRKLAYALQRFQSPRFECLATDFLSLSLEKELQKRVRHPQKAKVISNIPYHLTGIILQRLLPLHAVISSATLMMQEEVAKRCLSRPGDKRYSSLALFALYYSLPHLLFCTKSTCFYPEPSVRSAVVQFALQRPTHGIDPAFFFAVTRSAFQQRRKMLRASLHPLFSSQKVEAELMRLGLRPTARPEELSFTMFLHLAKGLQIACNDDFVHA